MSTNNQPFAFVGHQDLRPEDEPVIHEKLRDQFVKLGIRSLLVGNAKGGDQIARSVAEELNITIVDLATTVGCHKGKDACSEPCYGPQAKHIAENCDDIIVLWDGVFAGKTGGTSDVVYRALNGDRAVRIHHLVSPRESNPYPVSSLLDRVIDFEKGKFSRIPFAIPFSWIEHSVTPKTVKQQKSSFGDDGFRTSFLIPVGAALLTIVFGFWGFSCNHPYDNTNNFFRALNLITFDSSVIDGDAGFLLHFARLTGLITATSAIGFALYAATGRKRQELKRKKWADKKKFVLVLGLNQKSYDLIADLSRQQNVVVLYPDAQNVFLPELSKLPNVMAVQGNLSSGTTLKSVCPEAAEKVFIMSDSDTENIRALQEMNVLFCRDEPAATVSEPDRINWFVHLEDEGKRRFRHDSLSVEGRNRTNIFNVYENTVRRLLLYHPIDRFYQNPRTRHAHAVIIGFDKLGRQLTLSLLKQGHYSRDKYLHIVVYCKDAADTEVGFLNEYPQFRKSAYAHQDFDADIFTYTWSNIELRFEELPLSVVSWLDEENSLFSSIRPDTIMNIYACQDDGIQSAVYLNTLLPKIESMKQEHKADVQVFCYYNFPDKKEEAMMETHLNRLAPHTFVTCFGNFLDECSASCILDMSLDALPKLINAGYKNKQYNRAEILWPELSEKHKQSNRQAADHLWTKIRLVWPKINWKFDPKTFETYPEVSEIIFSDTHLAEYGEIEHRRWCADLLLQGFVPFNYPYGSDEYRLTADRWEDDEDPFKKIQQEQKKHISLVPYEHLTKRNQQKDIDQIKEIPGFLRRMVDTSQG